MEPGTISTTLLNLPDKGVVSEVLMAKKHLEASARPRSLKTSPQKYVAIKLKPPSQSQDNSQPQSLSQCTRDDVAVKPKALSQPRASS